VAGMNNNSDFRSPLEEFEHLNSELTEIKAILRDIAVRLNQIERHARRAFPGVKLPKKSTTSSQRTRIAENSEPTLTRDEALMLFETLRELAQKEGGAAIEKRLMDLSMADLRFLAQGLGVSMGSKPSRKKLNAGITGRVNESILLSKNVNVTEPRSAQEAAIVSAKPSDEPATSSKAHD